MKEYSYIIKARYRDADDCEKNLKETFHTNSRVHKTAEKEFIKKHKHLKNLKVVRVTME